MSRPAGRIVQGVIDRIDIDGVAQRIDINELLQNKIDINELLKKIDWDELLNHIDINKVLTRVDLNELLDSVDVNKIIDKVDIDRVLEKVDLVEVIERAELPALISRSSGNILEPVLNGIRSKFIMADQAISLSPCGRRQDITESDDDNHNWRIQVKRLYGRDSSDIAVSVQGRFAGICTRTSAFMIDFCLTVVLVAGFVAVVTFMFDFFGQKAPGADELKDIKYAAIPLCILVLLMTTLLTAGGGRTIGKMVFGLKVVRRDNGELPGHGRAFIRSLFVLLDLVSLVVLIGFNLFPYNFCGLYVFAISLIGIFRKDRRQLHDIITNTCVIYKWDAEVARYRQALERKKDEENAECRQGRAKSDVFNISTLNLNEEARGSARQRFKGQKSRTGNSMFMTTTELLPLELENESNGDASAGCEDIMINGQKSRTGNSMFMTTTEFFPLQLENDSDGDAAAGCEEDIMNNKV